MVKWWPVSCFHYTQRRPVTRLIPCGRIENITLKHLFLKKIHHPKRKITTTTGNTPMEKSCLSSYLTKASQRSCSHSTSHLLHSAHFSVLLFIIYSHVCNDLKSNSSTWLFWKSHLPSLPHLFHYPLSFPRHNYIFNS